MAHFATKDRTGSICTETGEHDVFSYGADDGPTTYCSECREAEPVWTILPDEEFDSRFPNK
jgi:hypothetical protein